MKRTTLVATLVFALSICLSLNAFAADQLLTAKVSAVKVAKDKNGSEYVRLMVESPRELNGISYVTATPAMAFGSEVAKAKTVKPGQTLKLIVSEREYQGRTSLTILKIVE